MWHAFFHIAAMSVYMPALATAVAMYAYKYTQHLHDHFSHCVHTAVFI